MAPSVKNIGSAKDRPKSSSATSRLVTLKVTPERLRGLLNPTSQTPKEDTPMQDVKDSPSTESTSFQAAAAATVPETASDSNPATPANGSTPVPSVMGPPGEGQGPKKKGVKKSAAAADGDAASKIRGKPGPKKRQRMDDGTLEPRPAAHRLGPKANQGAINAGLRALDRSGKPCRKWTKTPFKIRSFTGSEWEISRWSTKIEPKPIEVNIEAGVSASDPVPSSDPVPAPIHVPAEENSSKEMKENITPPAKSDSDGKDSNAGDVEM